MTDDATSAFAGDPVVGLLLLHNTTVVAGTFRIRGYGYKF
jgi:hypothetical protein